MLAGRAGRRRATLFEQGREEGRECIAARYPATLRCLLPVAVSVYPREQVIERLFAYGARSVTLLHSLGHNVL